MKKRLFYLLVGLGCILLLLTGCSGASQTNTPATLPQTTVPQTAIPSSTSTDIPVPSPTPTIPPVLPLTVGTALPQLETVISADNVDKIVEIATWTGHGCSIFDLVFSPNSQVLASVSCDKTLRLWDLTSGTERATIAQSDALFGSDFSPDGVTLVAWLNFANSITLYEVASASQVRTLEYTGSMTSAAFSPDGKTLATPTRDGLILLWDFTSGTKLSSLKPEFGEIDDQRFPIAVIKFSPDGKKLASGDGDKKVRLWDLASGTVQNTLDVGNGFIIGLALSSDGNILMVQSISYDFYANPDELSVRLFDVASGNQLRELTWDAEGYSGSNAALSPNGKVLAVGFADGTIILYGVASGSELRTLSGHTDWTTVAFSPDGKFIASGSGSDDRTIRLWGIYP